MLSRAGHDVHVYERSRTGLVGRGGGIGTSGPVLAGLMLNDVIGNDFPHLTGTSSPFIVRTAEHERLGYVPWENPIDLKAFHWSALWNDLRKRVPDDRYHRGWDVTAVEDAGHGTVTLQFGDGNTQSFDLVIFADGYQSLGRSLLFPESSLRYRGYMLWRGLLPESKLADPGPLGTSVPRLSYRDLSGNFVPYFVPGVTGSTAVGERLVNWAAYIPVAEETLPTFMVDRFGELREGTVPPGAMRLEEEERLKALMAEQLPTYYGDIVAATEDTYVQLIYTASVPAYSRGRMCLIGDAGFVAQPFTGSGVFKGYTNVKDLLDALAKSGNLDEALLEWGKEQVQIGQKLLRLGEQMEKAFIWDTLDLATADAATTESWWKGAVTFPEEFSYERDPR